MMLARHQLFGYNIGWVDYPHFERAIDAGAILRWIGVRLEIVARLRAKEQGTFWGHSLEVEVA